MTLLSMMSINAQLVVYLSSYGIGSTESFGFEIENKYPNPVYIYSIFVIDQKQGNLIYISSNQVVLHSSNGYGSSSPYYFSFSRSSTGSTVFDNTYIVEISYVEIRDGAQRTTERFYTEGGVGGIPLRSTAISDIKLKAETKRYYDLNGRIVEKPIKGHIYICNGKKIIY